MNTDKAMEISIILGILYATIILSILSITNLLKAILKELRKK